ncbi:alkaline phosphatase family protein [bacterium]|nr:alkaline phosphatase family protein [bacterium]
MARHTFLFFVDGCGWGETDAAVNPQHDYPGELFRLPRRPPAGTAPVPIARGGWARPLDAVLGVPGVPQSATGQTTLLSGVSGQGALGKHLTGFPNETLRAILLEHSVLKGFTDAGLRARFLNAYRPRFRELSREKQLTLSATTVANLAADLPFFDLDDVTAGRSIYQEMTNAELIARGFAVAPLTPVAAGRIAAASVREHDFLLYEYFQSDKAGHSGERERVVAELTRLDAFLGAVLDELAGDLARDTLVLLCSDHGNLEDASTRRHTTNPVPLLAWGAGAAEFVAPLARLDEVTPAILARHGVRRG